MKKKSTFASVTLGNRIESLRKSAGITQMELSKLIGVSNVQVSYYENDDQKPGADTLAKLAKAFNVKVDFLLTGVSDNPLDQLIDDLKGLKEDDLELINKMTKKLIRAQKALDLLGNQT